MASKNEKEIPIPSRDGELIAREYLDECGCMQSLQGYFILTKVICYAATYPTATSRELFKRYVDEYDDTGLTRKDGGKSVSSLDGKLAAEEWRRVYKTARYCFLKADNAEGMDFFLFIRLGANRIFKEVYLNAGNGNIAGESGMSSVSASMVSSMASSSLSPAATEEVPGDHIPEGIAPGRMTSGGRPSAVG